MSFLRSCVRINCMSYTVSTCPTTTTSRRQHRVRGAGSTFSCPCPCAIGDLYSASDIGCWRRFQLELLCVATLLQLAEQLGRRRVSWALVEHPRKELLRLIKLPLLDAEKCEVESAAPVRVIGGEHAIKHALSSVKPPGLLVAHAEQEGHLAPDRSTIRWLTRHRQLSILNVECFIEERPPPRLPSRRFVVARRRSSSLRLDSVALENPTNSNALPRSTRASSSARGSAPRMSSIVGSTRLVADDASPRTSVGPRDGCRRAAARMRSMPFFSTWAPCVTRPMGSWGSVGVHETRMIELYFTCECGTRGSSLLYS